MSAGAGTIRVTGSDLTLEQVEAVAAGGRRVDLAPAARERMQASRAAVERILAQQRVVYGINTGFGALASTRIAPDRLEELQHNLIRSHCAGVGEPFPPAVTRAMMLLRINTLAKGFSGIRVEVVERLADLLNRDLLPRVPQKGSVGASGDLAPLAHLAAPLLGEGQILQDGAWRPAAAALAAAGLQPVRLAAREGLALINGTAAMTAQGALALLRAERLARVADVAAAMSVEGLKGSHRAFDERIHDARGQAGQIESAANLRRALADSAIAESHRDCGNVQDAYALRCSPQVHGAVRDTLRHARAVLEREANAATDNPLIFAGDDESLSGGNFHGAPVGHVLDHLAIAISDLASVSERRINRLVHPGLSGLPAFLAVEPGLHSGFMLAHVSAAALVSENKVLSHPASVDSVPTSADTEDHVSMGTHAARKAMEVVENAETVLAIELMAGARALDLLAPLAPGRGVAAAHTAIRAVVPPLEADRPLHEDIGRIAACIRDGGLLGAVTGAIGELH